MFTVILRKICSNCVITVYMYMLSVSQLVFVFIFAFNCVFICMCLVGSVRAGINRNCIFPEAYDSDSKSDSEKEEYASFQLTTKHSHHHSSCFKSELLLLSSRESKVQINITHNPQQQQ